MSGRTIHESMLVGFLRRDQNQNSLAGLPERNRLDVPRGMGERIITNSSRNPLGHFTEDGECDELSQAVRITDEQKRLYLKRSFERDKPELLQKIIHFFSDDEEQWHRLAFAAAQYNSVRCLEFLLSDQGQPHEILSKCHGALREAISKEHIHIIEKFLEKGVDLNHRDEDGRPLLCCAIAWGKDRIVQILLDHGADPKYVDRRGNTLLHGAVEKGSFDMVKTLINAGVDINLKNIFKKTALDLAREKYQDTQEESYLSIANELIRAQKMYDRAHKSDPCSCIVQ